MKLSKPLKALKTTYCSIELTGMLPTTVIDSACRYRTDQEVKNKH